MDTNQTVERITAVSTAAGMPAFCSTNSTTKGKAIAPARGVNATKACFIVQASGVDRSAS